MKSVSPLSASFRDPAGYVFVESGIVKRAVTPFGRKNYEAFISSGLYQRLLERRWIVPHEEKEPGDTSLFKVLVPEQIPVISYPYEWCFSQLKDAAILTLDIQLTALECGLSLKDATPFNVQFIGPRPVFIDTLSFEALKEQPWIAYRQFCEMFLAPLALMAHVRQDFNKYYKTDLSGFDLAFCHKLLPRKTWFRVGLFTHIHLHAMGQAKFNDKTGDPAPTKPMNLSKGALIELARHLRSTVGGIQFPSRKTTWGDYYAEQKHYSVAAENFKSRQVEEYVDRVKPRLLLDLGGNTGKFSRLATQKGIYSVCADVDGACVEQNYRESKAKPDENMLPLLLDLSNPSGGLGWKNKERNAFFDRVKPDLILALALIHHLRITHHVPLSLLASFFSENTQNLMLEFVPKEDPMAQKLLQHREDVFHDYDEKNFEKCFGEHFSIERKTPLPETKRTLYCLKCRN